jgi:hypothetical protein
MTELRAELGSVGTEQLQDRNAVPAWHLLG